MTATPDLMRRAALMTLAALCALTASSCSLLVSFEECATTAECTPNPDANVSCQDNICVTTPLVLTGATCTLPANSRAAEPNAVRIGFMMPLSGDDRSYGENILSAVSLVIDEFNSAGGVRGRPLGLITCDTQSKEDVALAAARHLSTVARVSAIIGPDTSGQTLAVVNDVTIKNKVLLITPSGSSPAISGLLDDDLVWRTIISDTIQGEALSKMITDLISKSPNPDTAKIVLMLPADDAYSQGLAEILLANLPARYKADNDDLFEIVNYPNSSAGMSNIYSSSIANVASQSVKPDIVVLLSTVEAWEIIKGLETVLTDKKPIYAMTDGPFNSDASSRAFPMPTADLRARIVGTAAKTPDTSYAPYNSFAIRFSLKYRRQPTGSGAIAQGHDAAYLIGLGIAAGGVTGPDIAKGLRKLSDPNGTRFVSDINKLPTTINDLIQGKTINYDGASGPLDFNDQGDPSTGAVALWCMGDGGMLLEQPSALLDESGAFTPRVCPSDDAPDMDMGMPDMAPDMEPDMLDDMMTADMGD